jgi:hypothetical protein
VEYTVVNNVIVDVDRRVYYYLLFGRLCVFWPEPTRIVEHMGEMMWWWLDIHTPHRILSRYPHPSSDIL